MRYALPLLLAATALADEAQEALEQLRTEYEAAVEAFFRPLQEAQQKGEKAPLDFTKHPNREFAPRFLAFARDHAKTEAAAQALVVVLGIGSAGDREEAGETLRRDHMDSPALKGAVHSLPEDTLRLLAEKSPHAEVRGFALLRLAEEAMGSEPQGALLLLAEVKEKYGAIAYWGDMTLGQRADGCIFEIERLGIGKEAPDIEGEDLDGRPMKLSDHRGKVVVLDFWGDW